MPKIVHMFDHGSSIGGDVEAFVAWLRPARTVDPAELSVHALDVEAAEDAFGDVTATIRMLETAKIALLSRIGSRPAAPRPPSVPDPAGGGDRGSETGDTSADGESPTRLGLGSPASSGAADRREDFVAAHLDAMPLVRDAFHSGRLTLEQVHLLARLAAHPSTAEAFSESEEELLAEVLAARVDDTRRVVTRWRQRFDRASAARGARNRHRRRSFRHWIDAEGTAHAHFSGSGDLGARVINNVNRMLDDDWTHRRTLASDERSGPLDERTREQRAADVFALMTDLAVSTLHADTESPRPETRLHVSIDYFDLVEESCGAGGVELLTNTPLTGEAIQRLCCEAKLSRVVTRGASVVLDKGRATRLATPAQRDALAEIFDSCAHPDCDAPLSWTHVHHVVGFSLEGGRTDIDGLVPACDVHHHDLHEGGHTVERDAATGRQHWVTPDGARHPLLYRRTAASRRRRTTDQNGPAPPGPGERAAPTTDGSGATQGVLVDA